MDGFVLAGGRSSRMGSDKARLPWRGRPMAVAVAEALDAVCDRVALIRRGAPDGLPWNDVRGAPLEVLWEPDAGAPHPLWGVATALEAARGASCLVVPCDVPGIDAASLRRLVEAGPDAVAEGDGRRHPLIAHLANQHARRARELARAGGSVRAFAEAFAGVAMPAEALRNVNTREGLGPGPVARLLAGLPWLDDGARARVAAGEVQRLAARGMVDPDAPATVSSRPDPEVP